MTLPTRLITGHYPNASLHALPGSVTFTLNVPAASLTDKTILLPAPVTGQLDANGDLLIAIVPNDALGLLPEGTFYTVNERVTGYTADPWNVIILSGNDPLDLSSLSPLLTPPTLVSYVLLTSVGQVGGPAGPLDADGLVPAEQIPGGGGGGSGVTSVNGHEGAVTLGASDVGADASGAASSALTIALAATTAETTRATTAEGLKLAKASNLSDVANAGTARSNLGAEVAGAGASALANAQTYTDAETTRAQGAEALKLAKASNLGDLANAGTARGNLGLGGAAVLAVGTTTGTVAAGDDSRIVGAAQKSANLSDLGSPSAARGTLGLGGAALLNIGTTTGTAAAGDDSRIIGAAQKASNLADLASASAARGNLGLAGAALLGVGVITGTVAAGDDSRITGAAQKANNLSDLASAAAARSSLGLGSAAVANTLDQIGAAAANVALGGHKLTGVANGAASTDAAAFGQIPAIPGWTATDQGLSGWTIPVESAGVGLQCVSGTLYLAAIKFTTASVSTVFWNNNSGGSGLTAGANWISLLLASTGALIADVAVDSNGAVGAQNASFGATPVTPGAIYWLSAVWNGTTPPKMQGCTNTGLTFLNGGLTVATARFAINGTAVSTAVSVTPASNVFAGALPLYFGVK